MKSQVVRMSLAAVVLVLGRGISATPCDTHHWRLQAAVSDAHMPEPFHRRIASRIDAGWRAYASGVDSFRASVSRNLGDASSTVASSELQSLVPDDVRTGVAAALDGLKACVNASKLTTFPVNVTVSVRNDGDTTTRAGDVTIRVDGLTVAKTKVDGTASFAVCSETHDFEAEQSPAWRGNTRSNATAVAIVMEAGADLSTAAGLEFSPTSDGVLPPDFREATLQFVDDRGQLIRMKRIGLIELHSQNGIANVTSAFAVTPEGTLRLRERELQNFLAAIAGLVDPHQLSVHAFDASGASYRGMTSPFAVGRDSVRVQLVSPIDTPAKLDSTFIRVTNDLTGASFWSKTAGDGSATFTHMPAGRYELACDVGRTSERLFGRGSFQLDRDNASVSIPMSRLAKSTAMDSGPMRERWHAPGETADPHKVLEVSFKLTPEGTLKRAEVWEHDSWKILDSLSEEELKARLQRESVSDLDPDSRTIGVRVYDPSGQVIFRTAAILYFVSVTSHGRNHINPYVKVTLPAEIKGRMETEAVDARWDISLDIGAIHSELLR